jgi:dsDNA-binding SOS-regulon protein
MPNETDTVKHSYSSDAGVIEIDHDHVLDLRLLADGRSTPGSPVSVSDVLAEALAEYLQKNAEQLGDFFKTAEQEELERVAAREESARAAALPGGEAA